VLKDDGYLARLSDGTAVRARSVLAASGIDWRRLDDGLDELLGAGVYSWRSAGRFVLADRGVRVYA
jgi:hypothetical protein